MASKKTIEEVLDLFSQMWPTRNTENLIEPYFAILKGYSDKVIKKAVYDCLKESEYFPKPAEIIKFVNIDSKDLKHSQELKKRYTCPVCHEKVSALSEGKCLDCGGFPPYVGDHVILPSIEKDDFIIEGRRKCQNCGTIGICIKEPKEDGPWKCKDCYTGLDRDQRKQRWKDIMHAMKDRNFKPDWYEELPF
jgi:hypothetical protein